MGVEHNKTLLSSRHSIQHPTVADMQWDYDHVKVFIKRDVYVTMWEAY